MPEKYPPALCLSSDYSIISLSIKYLSNAKNGAMFKLAVK